MQFIDQVFVLRKSHGQWGISANRRYQLVGPSEREGYVVVKPEKEMCAFFNHNDTYEKKIEDVFTSREEAAAECRRRNGYSG